MKLIKIKDTNDTVNAADLKGEKLEMFLEGLTQQVLSEVEDAEDYLDENIRPRIEENWKYYRGELPVKRAGEAGYVDNTCSATVNHAVATALDAFNDGDTLELVPYGVTSPITVRVINQAINSILEIENNRFDLYQAFFRDSFVSCASVFKPYVKEQTNIDKRFFTEITEEEMSVLSMQYEMSMDYDRVEQIITEAKEITIEQEIDLANPAFGLTGIPLATTVQSQTLYTGYFALVKKEKTIKIEPIPAENFLINKDARSIRDARFVGHKSMVTISDLLELGFDYDAVAEVYDKCGGDSDAEDNEASRSRKRNILGDSNDATSVDNSQREVELFEVYIKSSIAETLNEDDSIAVSKLFQVFMAEEVILDYQEVDSVPYSGASPVPVPHMFWGTGMVDATKHIQTAKSGLMRQTFTYNEMASKPRFIFKPDALINPRDIYSTAPGSGIAVKDMNAIMPIQISAMAGDNVGLSQMLDAQREVGTGISFTGQGMLGEVLKSGGSTISAQMVLTEGQMMMKSTIETLLENAIKPLVQSIYNLMRENFSEWEISIDGETMVINPNDWPRLREIKVKTPLGKSAKLEKAQAYMSLFTTLATAVPGSEASKLASPQHLRELLVEAFEYQDVTDVSSFLPTVEEIQSKDQVMMQLQQMQGQMQQMMQQMQAMQQENQVLKVTASDLAQREMALKEQEAAMRAEQAADKQALAEDKQNADEEIAADKQALAEREQELKEILALGTPL